MVIERMTAKKVRLSDLIGGEWIKKEGMEPSFVLTKNGEKVSRARIMATVVSKFMSEDGNFGSITLDDATDTIRVKCFKEMGPIAGVEVGDIVDVVGKVREYAEEIYLMPEAVFKVENPNWELLRRLELLKKASAPAAEGKVAEAAESDVEKLRKGVLGIIESSKDGITYADVLKKASGKEEMVEAVINDLLAEGICYEPTPGKIMKI